MQDLEFKELRMSKTSVDEAVDLKAFADLAGFPVELIKKELFSKNEDLQTVSIDDLRSAMLKYLDSTMLEA